MKATRYQVVQAIGSERDYQNKRWAGHSHTSTEYLVYIEHYLNIAKQKASTLDFTEDVNHDAMLSDVRKIAALAVACMEEHGAPQRPSTDDWKDLVIDIANTQSGEYLVFWHASFDGFRYGETISTGKFIHIACCNATERQQLLDQGKRRADEVLAKLLFAKGVTKR